MPLGVDPPGVLVHSASLDQGSQPQPTEQQPDEQHHGNDERASKGGDLKNPARRNTPRQTQQTGVQDAQHGKKRTNEQERAGGVGALGGSQSPGDEGTEEHSQALRAHDDTDHASGHLAWNAVKAKGAHPSVTPNSMRTSAAVVIEPVASTPPPRPPSSAICAARSRASGRLSTTVTRPSP